jgi:hypothetical protein
MPTFEITTADGSVYQIDATDEATAIGALNFNPKPKAPAVENVEQRDAAHQQARDWLDANPSARHSYANNLLAQGVQGATLGWADEARAGLGAVRDYFKHGNKSLGEYYDLEKAMQDEQLKDAQKSTGMAGTAAEIAGSFLPGAAISKGVGALSKIAFPAAKPAALAGEALTAPTSNLPAVLNAAGSNLPAVASLQPAAATAAQRGLSALPRAMVEGGIAGGIQATGDDSNATYGGLLGAAGGGIGYGLGKGLERLAKVTNTAPRVAQAASTEDIKGAAQAAYDRFTDAGGLFTQQGLNDLAGSVRGRLTEMQWQPELAPKVTAFNRAMERARVGSGAPSGTAGLSQTATPGQIQNLRRLAGKISNSSDATESAYGSAIRDEIDNFLGTPREGNFASFDENVSQEDLARNLAEANRLWTQYAKADAVDEAFSKAERRAASTYSGGNENNAIRQELRRYFEKRGPENFTADEREAFETAIRGGRMENAARMLGKLAPSRGGLSTWANIGAGAGTGGATLPLTALAEGAKVVGDRATRRNLEEVSRVIRGGGNRRNVNVPPSQMELLMRQLTPSLAAPAGAALVRGLL